MLGDFASPGRRRESAGRAVEPQLSAVPVVLTPYQTARKLIWYPWAETRFPTRQLLDAMRREDKSATYLTDRREQEHLRCLGSQRHSSPPLDARAMVACKIHRAFRIVFPVTAGVRQAWPDWLRYFLYRHCPCFSATATVPRDKSRRCRHELQPTHREISSLARWLEWGRPRAGDIVFVFPTAEVIWKRTSAPTSSKPCSSPSGLGRASSGSSAAWRLYCGGGRSGGSHPDRLGRHGDAAHRDAPGSRLAPDRVASCAEAARDEVGVGGVNRRRAVFLDATSSSTAMCLI